MPVQIIPQPSSPAGWKKLGSITKGSNYTRANYELYFPSGYMPASDFMIVNGYDNTEMLWLEGYNSTLLGLIGFSGAIASVSIPIDYIGTFKRTKTNIVVGGSSTPVTPISPRFGFSIGDQFKQQSYVRLEITALGFLWLNINTWIFATAQYIIEYVTLCRMKKIYVRHGKLLYAGKTTSSSTSTGSSTNSINYTFKVYERDTKPTFSPENPGGNITVYKGDGSSAQFTINSVEDDWTIKCSSSSSPEFEPAADMFYILENPWIVEDPSQLFEYELSVDEDGYYTTWFQTFKVSGEDATPIGVWTPPSSATVAVSQSSESSAAETDTYTLYVDSAYRSWFSLPKTEEESKRVSEAQDFGGSFSEGKEILSGLDPAPLTVRIVLKYVYGSRRKQNFFSQCLSGEFLKCGDNYYLITAHPRSDTLEVMNVCITDSSKKFLDELDQNPDITVYQQRFWMMTEIYPYYLEDQSFATSTPKGTWNGILTSVDTSETTSNDITTTTTTLQWKAIERSELMLASGEATTMESKTLLGRCRNGIPSTFGSTSTSLQKSYTSYQNWKIYKRGSISPHEINSVEFTETSSSIPIQLDVEATLSGDASGDFSVGDEVYILFDEPFQSPFRSLVPYSNFGLELQVSPILKGGQNWKLWMQGWYTAGYYHMPTEIQDTQRFSISDFQFGIDGGALGRPYVLVSTRSRLSGISFVEQAPSKKQLLFSRDVDFNDYIVFRRSSVAWEEQLEKVLVRLGEATTVQSGDSPATDQAIVVAANLSYTASSGSGTSGGSDFTQSKTNWFYIPPNFSSYGQPYFSTRILGKAGVQTPLTKKYNVSTNLSTSTRNSPTNLPIEYYTPGDSAGKIQVPVYFFRNSVNDIWSSGSEVITSASKITSAISGESLSAGTIEPVDSLSLIKTNQALGSVGLQDVYVHANESLTMIYGSTTPIFYPVGQSSTTATDSAGVNMSSVNPSKESVFIIHSDISAENWGSPKYDYGKIKAANDTQKLDEWKLPLMLLYSFRFAGSIYDPVSRSYWVFGYGYTRDSNGNSTDGNADYLFLGVYRFSMYKIQSEETKKLVVKSGTGYSDGDAFAYYRRHMIKDSDFSGSHKMNFGPVLSGVYSSGESPTIELFTKIVGGSQSGAIITDLTIGEELIALTMKPNGEINLFIRDKSLSAILGISSNSGGDVWSVNTSADSDGEEQKLIYARNGIPSNVQIGRLFYFEEDVLKSKSLNTSIKGTYSNQQELLDGQPVSVVSSGIQAHKIAAHVNARGENIVYYFSPDGHPTASISRTSGDIWEPLVNW